MSDKKDRPAAARHSFLGALARDIRGNTIAIVAAALIPLAGLMGGGMDISRMYIVKTRLQHACDAGALAGRKNMGGGTWTQSSGRPNTVARQFFAANFLDGAYGSTGLTYSFTESAGKVSGTASATVPMTLMRVLGKTTETLSVNCDAEMRLPNTDVMFVLDTTGSMGDTPYGDSMSKIDSLKIAVKCFYEIVARLDTDANCVTGTPSGGTGSQTQIRFGFVPYATNVNVGKLLPTAWFADSWNYQTREAVYTPQTTYTFPNPGAPSQTGGTSKVDYSYGNWVSDPSETQTANKKKNCPNPPSDSSPVANGSEGSPYNVNTSQSGSTQTVTYDTKQSYYYYQWQDENYQNKTCYYEKRKVTYNLVRSYTRSDTGVATTVQIFSGWHYAQLPVNVGLLKNGTSWNSSFQWPINSNGTDKTISWDGCVEERETVSQSSYAPIPSGAKDLDLDSVPTPGDVTTQWKPVLPGLIQTRNGGYGWTLNESTSTNDYGSGAYYACPVEAKKLQAWPTASDFDDYVDQLTPEGNTYHDIGLIWGGRLLSPTGLFSSENALTPQGGEIERHLIFMTDGDPCTGVTNYTAYGVQWFDRRTTPSGSAPTDGCTTNGTLTQQVNARTDAICAAIKNKNITLWVITFGSLASSTVTRMTNCATPGRYFNATNAATIQTTFANIANQISQLRLTR
ncbi:MAG: hypothetical protein B7Y45_13235 [Sphingomonas sp. 28-66-16]|nr:MAG: hypothetical protein B7Y45_13235 [Sphingomonas sp. 28-66-16]